MASANISVSMRPEDLTMFDEFGKLAKKEGYHSTSAYIVELMKKEVMEHAKSHNPQTIITMFDRDHVTAIPNLYNEDKEVWYKFYFGLSPQDYDALTKRLEWVNKMHNEAKTLL